MGKSFATPCNILDNMLRKVRNSSSIVNSTYFSTEWRCRIRKNKTFVKCARCMLSKSKFQKLFWAEATANHVRNRCLTEILGRKTPYETGRKTSYETWTHYRRTSLICRYSALKHMSWTKLSTKTN